MKKAYSGFTLIELMIVVAIIAILAAIAIPAYNNYIREARMSKVVDHYDEAYRSIKAEMAKLVAVNARGGNVVNSLGGDPATTATWFGVVNPENRSAPEGGVPAYKSTADAANGVVQLTATGTAGALTNLSVSIVRPSYLELDEESVTINVNEI